MPTRDGAIVEGCVPTRDGAIVEGCVCLPGL